MYTLKIRSASLLALSAIALAACGGGDGGDATPAAVVNPFATMEGTWSSGCVNPSVIAPNGTTFTTPDSTQLVAVLSAAAGTETATVSIRQQTYRNSTTCEAAKLDQEGTIGGQLTALAGTKAIAGDPDHLKTGTAKTATFRYDSLSLHNVTMSLPSFGYTASVGYMLENGKLYGVSGSRASDGLGTRFANIALTKQ
jgi:hypothetical protein